MAIKSTIFKCQLNVADIGRNYYADHALVLARHPSETDVRMLMRITAFALNAHEHLHFSKGLSSAEEPDLWQIGLTGDIEHWIDLGQPVEKRVRQSCSKADRVSIYTYQKGAARSWFAGIESAIQRFQHLQVVQLKASDDAALARLVDRSMHLHCVIDDDGQVLLSNADDSLAIAVTVLKPAAP